MRGIHARLHILGLRLRQTRLHQQFFRLFPLGLQLLHCRLLTYAQLVFCFEQSLEFRLRHIAIAPRILEQLAGLYALIQ